MINIYSKLQLMKYYMEKYVDVLNDVYAQDEEKLVDKKDLRHLLNKYFGISFI